MKNLNELDHEFCRSRKDLTLFFFFIK